MTKLTLVPPKTELDAAPLDPGMEALIAERGALVVARTAVAGNAVLLERIERLENNLAMNAAQTESLERQLLEAEEINFGLRAELRESEHAYARLEDDLRKFPND